MGENRQVLEFVIQDSFTPATLPMARLAEYLADLATVLGEKEHVHFLESDFSMPFIFGYGFLLSSATPPTTAGWHGDLPGPGSARTCVPGFFDTAGFRPPSPYRWDGCCLRFPAKTSASRTEISFGAQ